MKKILIRLITFYQTLPISNHNACKFIPTCSEYTKEAIMEYGAYKGTVMGMKRIMRCNPWNLGGYDPVPKKGVKK